MPALSWPLQNYSQIPRNRITLNVHSELTDKENIHSSLNQKVEENLAICDSADEPGRHYTGWKKSCVGR